MEQVKSAYYTVSSHYARYSKWYTLDVVFEDKDAEEEEELTSFFKIL